MFDFQNPHPPALDEQVPEEQSYKEKEGGIPYSPLYCPICTHMEKECKAGQTVSDWDEEGEEKKKKTAPQTSSANPSSTATKTSFKQRYFDSKLHSPPSEDHQRR